MPDSVDNFPGARTCLNSPSFRVRKRYGLWNGWGFRWFGNVVTTLFFEWVLPAVSFPTIKELKAGTLAGILKQADISPDNFITALRALLNAPAELYAKAACGISSWLSGNTNLKA